MLIRLKEGETEKLTRLAGPGNPLAISFGPGGVWLDDEGAPWAMAELLKIRAAKPPEGNKEYARGKEAT